MLTKFKEQLNEKGEVYLKIKVKPGVGKTVIKNLMDDDTIKIDVAAPPTKGVANKELIKFLAQELEISKKNVRIISGTKERIKLVKIIKQFYG